MTNNLNNDFDVFACANYILDTLKEYNLSCTNLELAKCLYVAYGMYLSLYNERLFDNKIEAWRCCPLVPSVYCEFKNYGTKRITDNSRARIMQDFTGKITTPEYAHFTEERCKCLSIAVASLCNQKAWNVFDFKGKNSAWAKVNIGEVLNNDDINKEFEAYHNDLAKFLLNK